MWIELFSTLIAAAFLIFGLVLSVPVTIWFAYRLDRRPAVTIGVKFLIFKHHFSKENKSKRKAKVDRTKKRRTPEKDRPPAGSATHMLPTLIRERETIVRTVATFAGFVKKLVLSADRYYIELNLSGGLSSPDFTGQLYGLIQACRSIPSDSLSLSFHPNFTEDELRGTIAAGTVFRIYKILIQLMAFVWHLPIIKLIKLYRKYRKETGNV